jgi:ABC-2 type transport system permease protein
VTRLLGAELLKLRTTRTAAALLGAAVALGLLFLVLGILLSDPGTAGDSLDMLDSGAAELFILVAAIVAVTGEYRHGTIASTLLASPVRRRQLAAQAVAYAAAGVALALVLWALFLAIGLPLLSSQGAPAPHAGATAGLIAREVSTAALLGVLGVGIGSLVTSQPAALIVTFGVILFVEPTLGVLVDGSYGYGPGGAAGALSAIGDDSLPSPLVGGLVLAGWAAALLVAGAVATERRDIG